MTEWHSVVEIEGEEPQEEDFSMPDKMDAEDVAKDVVRCLWKREQMNGDAILNAYKLEFLQLKRYVKRAKKALLR